VTFLDPAGDACSVPANWTDAVAVDPLSLLKTRSARTETQKVAGKARGVADEFEVSALSWTGVMKSGATSH